MGGLLALSIMLIFAITIIPLAIREVEHIDSDCRWHIYSDYDYYWTGKGWIEVYNPKEENHNERL